MTDTRSPVRDRTYPDGASERCPYRSGLKWVGPVRSGGPDDPAKTGEGIRYGIARKGRWDQHRPRTATEIMTADKPTPDEGQEGIATEPTDHYTGRLSLDLEPAGATAPEFEVVSGSVEDDGDHVGWVRVEVKTQRGTIAFGMTPEAALDLADQLGEAGLSVPNALPTQLDEPES